MTDTDIQAVDTPAPDANATPEVQATEPEVKASEAEPSPAAEDSSDSEPKPKGVAKRIDELTRNWREAERREQALLALLQQRSAPEPDAPVVEAPEQKTLADFGYDESKYQRYLFEEATKQATEAAKRALKEEAKQREQEKLKEAFASKVKEFSKANPDWEEVAGYAPISDQVAGIIREMDDGPAVAYYLGKNHEEARLLSQLPKSAAALRLGRIEATLAFEKKQLEEAKKRVSNAPPPTPKLEAVDADVEKDPDQMSIEEWKKWRDKRDKNRRK